MVITYINYQLYCIDALANSQKSINSCYQCATLINVLIDHYVLQQVQTALVWWLFKDVF